MAYYLGYDIGGTKCAVCLGEADDGGMRVIGKHRIPTAGSPTDVLTTLADAAGLLLAERGLDFSAVAGAGISSGGPLSSARGVILSPPNLPGWDEVAVVDFLFAKTGVSARLENDANACAVAEWRYGAGRGTKDMIFLTFGTGLGAGVIANGQLVRGAGDNAGEIGHVRLTDGGPVGYNRPGSCEGWCSGGGIARLARLEADRTPKEAACLLAEAGDTEHVTAALIARLADAGDAFCRRIYTLSGEKLGRTLAILADILDPERIVIGSVFARSEHLLRPAMERTLSEEALHVPEVVPAALGDSIGDIAALAVALG